MENNEVPMEKKVFKAEYEMRVFCDLPLHLKERVVNFDEQEVFLQDIDPLSLVCVQVSDNPGIKPFIIEHGKTSFDLFKQLAEKRGFSIQEFNKALQKSFSEK